MKAFKAILAIFILFGCQNYGHASAVSCAEVHAGHDTIEWATNLYNYARKTRQERAEAYFPASKVMDDLNFIDQAMAEAAPIFMSSPQATDLDRKVMQVLRDRIANMKTRDEVPMKEYVLLCAHVSLALTRKIQLEGLTIVEQMNYRIPVFESVFSNIIENPMTNEVETIFRSLDGKTIRARQTVALMWEQIGFSNQNLVFLPTSRVLTTYDFNQLFRTPVHFLGLSKERMYIDGIFMSPFEFFMHDRLHARDMFEVKKNWDPQFQKERDVLDALFNANFPKIKDKRLQHTVHAYWFYIFHEKTNFRKFGTAYTKEAALKYLESNVFENEASSIDNTIFINRTGNSNDLGAEFTNVPPPDEATLKQAILWIKNMLLSAP